MEIEVQDYLAEFGSLRELTGEAIRGLDDEAANWLPLPEGTNSIYAILSHLTGGQNHWVQEIISGEVIQRDREAELHASGHLAELLRRWEKRCLETETILGNLSPAQLAELRTIPHHPEWGLITVRRCILHIISHLSIHIGHLQLTRQMWEQRPG